MCIYSVVYRGINQGNTVRTVCTYIHTLGPALQVWET